MLKQLVTVLMLTLFLVPLSGQSWTKLKKEGEEFAKEGFYMEAADAFYRAWLLKPEKLELAYKAGTYSYLVKEYALAVNSLEPVSHWNEPDKIAGYKYARALKQNGQHEEAIIAFNKFLEVYQGPDKDVLSLIIEREVSGSRLAMFDKGEDSEFELVFGGKTINSASPDFAPVMFGNDVLYFSSTRTGKAELYRSIFKNSQWNRPDTPNSLPNHEEKHVANGSFSSDGQRFYFTMCGTIGKGEEMRARCDIYLMNKRGDTWGSPRKLPEYVNEVLSTQTQPSTTVINGLEYVFFSSDRPGGEGGLDIWYTTRDPGSKSMDYTLPVNAGASINSIGDEQTPYYDEVNMVLYFASNGHTTYGGIDVFHIGGHPENWGALAHPGRPVNSEADDFYFTLNDNGSAGFLVSNRKVEGYRDHTRDEDLFYLSTREVDLMVTGKVLNRNTNETIQGARVYAYHMDGKEKNVFFNGYFEDGVYQASIPKNLEVWLVAEKPEFEPASYRIDLNAARDNLIAHNFILRPEVMPDEVPILAEVEEKKEVRENEMVEVTQPLVSKPVIENLKVEKEQEVAELPAEVLAMEPAPKILEEQEEEENSISEQNGELSANKKSLQPYQNKVNLPNDLQGELANRRVIKDSNLRAEMKVPERDYAQKDENKEMPDVSPVRANEVVTITEMQEVNEEEIIQAVPSPDAGWKSQVGVSSNENLTSFKVEELMKESQFRGQGLDKRYKGNRVDKVKYESETRAFPGVYYRVQLEATTRPDVTKDKYDQIKTLGEIEVEALPGNNLYRILIGVYQNLDETIKVNKEVQQNGFQRAFIVRYEDGVRLRRWR
jgi:hypothetical protein